MYAGDGEKHTTESVKKAEEEKKWTAIVRNFTQETTFHGVKYIAADTRYKSRRITWVIIVFGVLITFTYALTKSVFHYYEYPSNIELEVGYWDEVPFPAIAICNENPYRLTASHEAGLYDVITQTYDKMQNRVYPDATNEDYYLINLAVCDLPPGGAAFQLKIGSTSISVCKDLCSNYKHKYCSGILFDVQNKLCTLTSYTGNEGALVTKAEIEELQKECAERRIYFYRRIRFMVDGPLYCNFEMENSQSCRFFKDETRAKEWFVLQATDKDITFGSENGHYLFVHAMTEFMTSSAEIHARYINTTGKCLFALVKILGVGNLSLKVSAISEDLIYTTIAYINNTDIDEHEQDVWRNVFKPLPFGIHQISIEALFGTNSDGEFFLDEITINSCAAMTSSDSCIKSALGSEFVGNLSTNIHGETCAVWKEVVSYHNLTLPLDVHIPDASWEDAQNNCRFVHGISTTSPGCFNEDVEYASCEIERCPCEQNEFRCKTSGVCVPLETTCDYKHICEDMSDEAKICDSKNSISCDFSDSFICGYKQLNNFDQLLWVTGFDTSALSYYLQLETQGYVVPGLVVTLSSPYASLSSNSELSITFKPFYTSENNAIHVWFQGDFGYSSVPLISHDNRSHTEGTPENALFEKEFVGEWIKYKTCLPETEGLGINVVIDAVYNSMDEEGFQIGEINLSSTLCTVPDGYYESVVPNIDSSDCSFDEDICAFEERSDHTNLTWTLLPKDTVASAMYVFNQTTFINMDCNLCINYGDTEYDFIYFGDTGTIQSTNYPDNYPNYANNKWLIKGSHGMKIYIEFMFVAIEYSSLCIYDQLTIRDVSNQNIKRYCGLVSPVPYTSSGPMVEIEFISDFIVNGKGFQLNYTMLTDKHMDKVAVLSYAAPHYTEGILYAYFRLSLVNIGGQGCLSFEYINLAKFKVDILLKQHGQRNVYNGSDINFPQWKKVYVDYNNTELMYQNLLFTVETIGASGRQLVLALNNVEYVESSCEEVQHIDAGSGGIDCDFESFQLCGYTQSPNYHYSWVSAHAYSNLAESDSRKVLKLVNIVPGTERERFLISSPLETLDSDQVVSVSLQELSDPEKNSIKIWLSGSQGHSSYPIAIHDGSNDISRKDFPLVVDVRSSTTNKVFDLCLPAGNVVLTLEALYGTLDEFVMNNITVTGTVCDASKTKLNRVFPAHESSDCNSDTSVLCPFNGLSDHKDLTWFNIAEQDVIKAMSMNYVQSSFNAGYKADYDNSQSYDDVYFALSGTIQSPVYSSIEQTQFEWLVETPADTTIEVRFDQCNFDRSCDYQMTFKEGKYKTVLCGSCDDYDSRTNQLHIVYQRKDPGSAEYGFVLHYQAIRLQRKTVEELTGIAWVLHYSGQLTTRAYGARLVTPLIESTGNQCLTFAYVSQTSLTVNIIFANGSISQLLQYTKIPSPLLWSNFCKTISEEVGSGFYIEFLGEKSETYNKRYYLAVSSLQIIDGFCEGVEAELSDDMKCTFDDPGWCGYKGPGKSYPGWVSQYLDHSYTDLGLGLSLKGHETVGGMISYLWSPPHSFSNPSSVIISVKDTEQKLSLWLHGTYGLSLRSIENSLLVNILSKGSDSIYFVCVPGGDSVTQQLVLMAEYTAEEDIIIESVDVSPGMKCDISDNSLFEEPITINNMSLEVNSFRFLPENKHFSLTTIPQCSIGEAAQVLANDGKLLYDGELFTDILFTLTGELLLSSLDDLTQQWLIIMPEGIGMELYFEYINIGESGDPCQDIFLRITDGDENNVREVCGLNNEVNYVTNNSKVWISLEKYVEQEPEFTYTDFVEQNVYFVKSERLPLFRISGDEPPEGFSLVYTQAFDDTTVLDDEEENFAVLYRGEPAEIGQGFWMVSAVVAADTDYCLTFNYQSFLQLSTSVTLLYENGTEREIFQDNSLNSSFWREAVINIVDTSHQSPSLVFKATKKPNTDNAYFIFINSIVLHPQSCDHMNFSDSSVNCTFGDGSCGYIDMSGNPYSKWLRDMSNSAVTGSSDFVSRFISHNMTTDSSPLLSPVFSFYEDSCLNFRVFQIHKSCIAMKIYKLHTDVIETVALDCSYKHISSWASIHVDLPLNAYRFSFTVMPNKGLIQELYIDDIVLHPNPCPKDVAIKQGSEDRQNSSDAELIDITRTYISEDQMLDVLVESLDMSWHSVLQDVSHDFSDSLLSCKWNGQECEKYMVNQTVTDMGVCISFNTHHKTLLSERSGSQHGLKLTLNTETYEHIPGIGTDSGFKIQFYDPAEIPIMGRKGQVVSPGIHAMFTLNYAESKFLEPKYGTCGSVDLEEYPGVNYTTSHCLMQCYTDLTEKQCHCRLPYMPGNTETKKQCTLQTYLECVLMLPQNSSQTRDKCSCPDSCDKVQYEGQMSYSALSGLAMHTIIGTKQAQVQQSFKKAMEIDQRLSTDVFSAFLQELTSVLDSMEALELFVQVRINVLIKLLSSGFDRLRDIAESDVIMSTSEIIEANQIYDEHMKKERQNVVNLYKDLPNIIWEFVHYVKWNHYPEERISTDKMEQLQEELDNLETEVKWVKDNFDAYIYLYVKTLNDTSCKQQASDFSKFPYCPDSLHVGVDETYFPLKAVLDEDLYETCKTLANTFHEEMSSFITDFDSNFYGTGRYPYTISFPGSYENYIEVVNISVNHAESITELLDNVTQCLTEYGDFLEDTMSWRYAAKQQKTWNTHAEFSTVSDLQAIKLLTQKVHDWYASASLTKEGLSYLLLHGNGVNSMTSTRSLENWINTFSDQFDQYVADMRNEFDEMKEVYGQVYQTIVETYMNFVEYLGTGTNDTNIRGLKIFRNPRPQVLSSQVKYLYTEDQVTGLTSGDIFNFLNRSSQTHIRDNLAGYFDDLNYLLVEYKSEKDSVTASIMTAIETVQDTAQAYLDTIELQPSFIPENILQVDVYYAELKYSKTEQKVAYSVGDFFSDLGGFLGLLLGASIITVFEVLDLIIYNIVESKAFKNKVEPQEDTNKSKRPTKRPEKPGPETIVVQPYIDGK